jgi:hypothetical protein
MSPHADTLFWYRANQSLLFLLSAACLAENQLIPIIWEITLVNSEADKSVASVRCQTDSTAIHMSNSTTHIQPDSLVRNQSSCSLSIKPVRSIQQSAIDVPLTIQQSVIDVPLIIQQPGVDVTLTYNSQVSTYRNYTTARYRRTFNNINWLPGIDVPLTIQSDSQASTYR